MVLNNPFNEKEKKDENIVQVEDFSKQPSFVTSNDFQKSKSLAAAQDTLSSQLGDIQRKMQEVKQRREEIGESQAEQAERAKANILVADVQDAGNLIGGLDSNLGQQERMQAEREDQGLQREDELMAQELASLEDAERMGEREQVGLLSQEELEAQAFQDLENQQIQMQELNDPNSQTSQSARQELALLGVAVPENFSASQIQGNKELLLEAEKQRQNQAFEQQKHDQKLQMELMKEQRDLNKQIMLADRKDAATLSQAQKRRSEKTMDAYFEAKDAIDLVNRGGNAAQPNQATDASLLEGYERLLKNRATSYDEDGRPIVNKGLLDQFNNKIGIWKERLKGNKGILTEEDRRSLVQEAQNLYKVEQGFNVKRLKNVVDWSDQMSEKNPNVGAGFVLPGIDREILEQEMQEFFPDGDTYTTTEEKSGFGVGAQQSSSAPAPQKERTKFVPGQGMGRSSSGRKIFGR